MSGKALAKRVERLDAGSASRPWRGHVVYVPRDFAERPEEQQERAIDEMFARNGLERGANDYCWYWYLEGLDRPMFRDEYMWTIHPDGWHNATPKPKHLRKPGEG